MCEEIAEAFRIQAEVRPANSVVLAYKVSITDAGHEPEGLLNGNIECLLPLKAISMGTVACLIRTHISGQLSRRSF